MRISEVVELLEGVQRKEGDLELVTITGFWVRPSEQTGERQVVASVGDGQSAADLLASGAPL